MKRRKSWRKNLCLQSNIYLLPPSITYDLHSLCQEGAWTMRERGAIFLVLILHLIWTMTLFFQQLPSLLLRATLFYALSLVHLPSKELQKHPKASVIGERGHPTKNPRVPWQFPTLLKDRGITAMGFHFFFFWLHPQHVEVPGPGIKPKAQQ